MLQVRRIEFSLNYFNQISYKMPLIILTGVGCSGKTTRANELKKYFEEKGKEIHIISENEEIKKAGFDKNVFFQDSQKEKQIRGILKSEVLKLIGSKNLVILDAGNYIKGYRYELYCATKENKSTQCTVQCLVNFAEAFKLNESRDADDRYTKETFDALSMRYEEPNAKNRWDAPLFTVMMTDSLDFDAIAACLFDKKPPRPNMATQNAPLSDTNFLYELDRVTNEITQVLISAKKLRSSGEVKIPGHTSLTVDISNASIAQLNMLRRQYIVYSKMHTPEVSQIPILFVQYIKANLIS